MLAHRRLGGEGVEPLVELRILGPQRQGRRAESAQAFALDLAADPPVRIVRVAHPEGLPAPGRSSNSRRRIACWMLISTKWARRFIDSRAAAPSWSIGSGSSGRPGEAILRP
ncbi:hypothetical protein GCM10025881_30320 [Pseudolysinimonas kribbensis]|uniref:Uncharacterized protein n=1 Tax=Pseudolysinimonas kribbensis TaxID=433641 RepID=A0ABQ6K6D9_9MICO|nr:hypothetical protein GCM10025881_30320 [Pseudolysinimonas kribbensis]